MSETGKRKRNQEGDRVLDKEDNKKRRKEAYEAVIYQAITSQRWYQLSNEERILLLGELWLEEKSKKGVVDHNTRQRVAGIIYKMIAPTATPKESRKERKKKNADEEPEVKEPEPKESKSQDEISSNDHDDTAEQNGADSDDGNDHQEKEKAKEDSSSDGSSEVVDEQDPQAFLTNDDFRVLKRLADHDRKLDELVKIIETLLRQVSGLESQLRETTSLYRLLQLQVLQAAPSLLPPLLQEQLLRQHSPSSASSSSPSASSSSLASASSQRESSSSPSTAL